MNRGNSIQKKLLNRMRRLEPGKVHISKDFLVIGSRDAVDQALSRLVASGAVKRLGRGLFYIPRVNATLGIELAPDMDEVAQALARKTGSRVIPSGAVAANRLGLSTQVPAKPVYLTDGRTRTVQLGNLVLTLKHAPPKDLPWQHPTSALVFLGLRYLGKKAIGDETISRLRRRLSPADRRRLLQDIRYATDWVAEVVREVCRPDGSPRKSRHG